MKKVYRYKFEITVGFGFTRLHVKRQFRYEWDLKNPDWFSERGHGPEYMVRIWGRLTEEKIKRAKDIAVHRLHKLIEKHEAKRQLEKIAEKETYA